jgi:hypothetical protein
MLTQDRHDKVVSAIRGGSFLEVAGAYAGISKPTLHEWLARGRAAQARRDRDAGESEPCPTCEAVPGDPCVAKTGKQARRNHANRVDRWAVSGFNDVDEAKYLLFFEDVEAARAASEVRAVTQIQQAAMDGTWQAAAWYLERSQPGRWGRQRVELSGPNGGPVQVEVGALEERIQSLLSDEGE